METRIRGRLVTPIPADSFRWQGIGIPSRLEGPRIVTVADEGLPHRREGKTTSCGRGT